MRGTHALARTVALVTGALMTMAAGYAQERELTGNLFANPSFEQGMTEREPFGVPTGWSLYQGDGADSGLELSDDAADGDAALLIRDGDPAKEIGVVQEVEGEGGITYEAGAMVRALEPGSGSGAHIQLRFLPSNEFRQVGLASAGSDEFGRILVVGLAPPDTETVRVYFYTHRGPTPSVLIDDARLIGGVEPPPPPPPPPPEPVPPVYEELKDLHLQTELVADGEPRVTIVTPARYGMQARRIADAIERISGGAPPIVDDADDAAAVPADDGELDRHFICMGNRSTNAMLGELYNRFYTLLDLRYPGPGGHVVRTCHNLFGDGHNIVFVGGSDDAGVAAATDAMIDALGGADGGQGELTVGRLMEIELGEGVQFSRDVRELEIWDASKGYGSTGYFGWNSISKHAAAYYMTGDEHHAREFIRLAFPDEEARAQIAEIDGERIENKDDPLAGPYHYNAHMMILFWDLIEESDVFTDEERLRVTNAFSRQLDWRKGEGIYGLQEPARAVGSRHGQYSAISLYCLARYFAKDYPDAVWRQGVLGPKMHFAALESSAWVHGEADNLFWYTTGTAPVLRFMLLSGWREPMGSGALATLLRGQEILCTGKSGDWDLRSGSITYFHRAAYLTQHGRWLEYLRRTEQDLSVPRLGQSFWPEEHLQPQPPTDLVGRWSIHPLPEPMWASRGSGLPHEHSFQFGSFRSADDHTGDFILIDGYNGASRNPYHTFAVLELRLAGATLLKGYRNQVLTRVDGMVEPVIAMDGALRHRSVVGDMAVCVGEVPRAAYCSWRRTLAQRIGRYALVVDELTMRESSDNIQVQTLWETPGSQWLPERNAIGVSASATYTPPGWINLRALTCRYGSQPTGGEWVAELGGLGIVLMRATEVGHHLEMTFALPEAVEGRVYADFLNYVDRGVFEMSLDGEPVGERYDSYAESAQPGRADLGRHRLAAGEHTLRVEVVERGRDGERSYIGLMGVSIRPEGADEEPPGEVRHEILPGDPVRATRQGNVHTLEWVGSAREGERLTFFTLVGRDVTGDEARPACMRLAENAAALALPEPAITVAGDYAGTQATLAIIADSHLYARELVSAGADETLAAASEPLELSWDFETGTATAVADGAATLRLRVEPGTLTVDGEGREVEAAEGMVEVALEAGEHVITGVRPAAEALASLRGWLDERRAEAGAMRAEAEAGEPPGALPEVAELARVIEADVGGAVSEVITIPNGEGGRLICAAEGARVHILGPDGAQRAVAEADGDIRVMRWWPEHELLLVGCADEQVIAFDRAGERRWGFTSEMHPAVFRAAKTYWFKSAPAHAGIWGLYTTDFIDGESQCVVGSACTLEFIDAEGQLVHRMPQFWGDPHVFQVIDGPEGSVNLLAARRINGTHRVGIINSETLDPDRRGFNAVPSGHTYVGGWSSLNRYHLFYEDLDGDGEREVVSEINGSWNRVTAWDRDGNALHDASFGPGNDAPTRNMRDLVVADLDGDGTMEVVTATSGGLVVCLDHELSREWARAVPAAANVMMAVPAEQGQRLLVGCDDGTIALLDAGGEVIRAATVEGRPAWRGMALLQTNAGPVALVGTSEGAIVGLQVQ